MDLIRRLNENLNKEFGGAVKAHEDKGCVVLTGSLNVWDDIVKAGRMAVNKKKYLGVINDIEFTGGEIPKMKLPDINDSSLSGRTCDVLIIGAGIIGSAIARELSRYDLDIILVEKEHDVALHASSRNDGEIHPGVDLLPGQVKRKYNSRGNAMYDRICKELDVPFKRPGQYLCFKKTYMKLISKMARKYWKYMKVPSRYVSRDELKEKIKGLDKDIKCAIYFPTAGIVCPYGLTIAYAENAVQNGVTLCLDTAVTGMDVKDGEIKSVITNRGRIYPGAVINAAGVFSDVIAQMADDRFFTIHARKGTNAIIDKKAAKGYDIIMSSFGTSAIKKTHTKGGGIMTTADGNFLIGPDAVETYDREDFSTTGASIDATLKKQRATLSVLDKRDIITYYTGVRAATYEEDFVITKGRFTKNIVHAAGIQSPGLTAAPAIAVDVARMAKEILEINKPVKDRVDFNPIRKSIPRTSAMSDEERQDLISKDHDFGVIICRCEEVSLGEIKAALNRPVPCDTIDGVKRRVRPGMGRCQGGFCGPQVLKIISEEKNIPFDEVLKSGFGSRILYGDTKGVKDE